MKRILFALCASVLVSSLAYAQTKTSVGVGGEVLIPTGDFSDSHEAGVGFSMILKAGVANPLVYPVTGVSYSAYQGKAVLDGGESESLNVISLFFGPQIGKENGLYILPAVAVNLISGLDSETRIGYDLGGGYILPIGGGSVKLNLNAKFSFLNVLNKETGEGKLNAFRISTAVHFNY